MSIDLTICSVSYKQSKHILANINLTKAINITEKINWLIVDNAFEDKSFFDNIEDSDSNVKIFSGVPNNFNDPKKESKHHAAGLDLIVRKVKTRFILIIDPDFYVVMPNWIQRITSYALQNKPLAML